MRLSLTNAHWIIADRRSTTSSIEVAGVELLLNTWVVTTHHLPGL
jgi:hypothetical protein